MATDPTAATATVDPDRDATALGLGALFAGLVAISLWASAVGTAARSVSGPLDGSSAIVVVSGLTSLAGLGLGAVAYARYRGLDIGTAAPFRGAWLTTLGAIAAPAVLVAGVAAAGNVLADVTLSAMTQRWVAGDAVPRVLLVTAVVPAVFVGVGYGVLFCGVVYERVRALVGPDHAVAVAAAMVAFFRLLPIDAVAGLPVSLGNAVELVASLVFGVAFGMAVGVLSRHVRTGAPLRALDPRHAAVLVLAGVGIVGVATDLTSLSRTVGDLLWITALGVAIVGYERTRSVWVPVLSIATFQVAVLAVLYLEARLGLAVL